MDNIWTRAKIAVIRDGLFTFANMKKLPVIFIVILFELVSCQSPAPIDEVFRWPSSGVAEADSLILDFERHRNSIADKRSGDSIIDRFCSVAALYPGNSLLSFRSAYMRACMISDKDNKSLNSMADSAMAAGDSASYPYDWHMMKSLKIWTEADLVKRYNMIVDNIGYFHNVGAVVEEARNLIAAGNIMLDFTDSVRALDYFQRAADIYERLNIACNLIIAKNNVALASRDDMRDSIYRELRDDLDVTGYPRGYVLILHNSAIYCDSLELVDKAISLYNSGKNIDKTNLPLAMAMKGNYYVRHGEPEKAVGILLAGLDTAVNNGGNTRAVYVLHNMLADAYYFCGEKDLCIEAFSMARELRDSLDREYDKPGVYAMDAKARIEMADRNAHLERERIIGLWAISVLVIALAAFCLIFRIHRKSMKKRYEERLTEEKLRRNRQAILAQAKVIEEGDRLVADLTGKINEFRNDCKLSDESADALNMILRLHKSNEDNRQGFLKVQQELDSRFLARLKADFPSLSEIQLRLASMIAVGVDSRQICSILNIEQSTVYKSRYRLRTSLGLTSDQSLEEFLRRYNDIEPDSWT